MVVHSLHQVAHEFRIKERHRQLQELDEEVAYQRDIDAQGYVKQQPSAYKVDCRSADGKHQLSQEYKPNKSDVLVLDADIHDGLSKEGQDKLQETSDDQAQDDLSEILAIFLHIPKRNLKDLFSLIFSSPSILYVKNAGVVSKNIAMPLSSPLDFVLIQCCLNSSKL